MEKTNAFNEEAMDRIMSPESLDAYVRVAKPGAWLVTLALLLLVAAVGVWGFTDSLPETLSVYGVFGEGGEIVCYVNAADINGNIHGSPAKIVTAKGEAIDAKVTGVSVNPLSRPEIAASLSSDWLTSMMAVDGYAYRITLAIDPGHAGYTLGELASVTLITAEMKPISLIFS